MNETTHLLFLALENTETTGTAFSNEFDGFAKTNELDPGANCIAVSCQETSGKNTDTTSTHPIYKYFQVPSPYEESGDIKINPNLGIEPKPVEYNTHVSDTQNLTPKEWAILSIAKISYDPLVWLSKNDIEMISFLNVNRINYCFRKDS